MLSIFRYGHITSVLRGTLHWLPVHITFQDLYTHPQLCQQVSIDVFTEDRYSVSADARPPRLCSADHGDLVVPRTNTSGLSQRGFSVFGPNQWNHCKFGKCLINQNSLLEH